MGAERAPDAIVCLDTFHLVSWATGAVDEVRRTGGWHGRPGPNSPRSSSSHAPSAAIATSIGATIEWKLTNDIAESDNAADTVHRLPTLHSPFLFPPHAVATRLIDVLATTG